MAGRMIAGIEIEAGSGNVFADPGLRDAGKLEVKSGLLHRLRNPSPWARAI